MSAVHLLTTSEELDQLLDPSRGRCALIFKHSLVCPISASAHAAYEDFVEKSDQETGLDFSLIEIQNARPVSNLVAKRTGIQHESPQALLIKEGQVVWHASHWQISFESIRGAVEEHVE